VNHKPGKSPEEGEDDLIGDAGLPSPPLPQLLPPESDNEEDEGADGPEPADGLR
jgi:hypothetical protein